MSEGGGGGGGEGAHASRAASPPILPHFFSPLPSPALPHAEPSNYLDRDSLGALAAAIKEFGGGVLLVTHHSDFTSELCSETWNVENGILSTTGTAWLAEKLIEKEAVDEVVDGAGNVIKIKKKLTGKELRCGVFSRSVARSRPAPALSFVQRSSPLP